MPLTLESCRRNPTIDWLIFSDQTAPTGLPPNVKVIPITLRDFYAMLFQRLNIEGVHQVLSPHKLIDFKPTYGEAFQDYVHGYDFWGFCDIDIIWGRLRAFYTDDLFSKFDILTSSRAFINGQCTFLRNDPKVNSLFRQIPNALELLAANYVHGTDEEPFDAAARILEQKGELKVSRRRVASGDEFTYWGAQEERLVLEDAGAYVKPRMVPVYWEEGRMFHCATGDEVAFHHFMKGKTLYVKRAWSYPYWMDSMTGMDLNAQDILMRFKQGQIIARWKHFFTTRFGRITWEQLRPYVLKIRRAVQKGKSAVKGLLPGLAPYYRRLRGRGGPKAAGTSK